MYDNVGNTNIFGNSSEKTKLLNKTEALNTNTNSKDFIKEKSLNHVYDDKELI